VPVQVAEALGGSQKPAKLPGAKNDGSDGSGSGTVANVTKSNDVPGATAHVAYSSSAALTPAVRIVGGSAASAGAGADRIAARTASATA
jgi:hypothetical protein